MKPLPRSFFQRDFITVARDLIGTHLIQGSVVAKVVEVEAYGAVDDPACHTMSRPSSRDFLERNPAGTAYVYLNYGMYWLLNVLAKGGGPGSRDGIILFRALAPVQGLDEIRQRRKACKRDHDLCAGPGKLGLALALDKSFHGHDLTELASGFYMAEGEGASPIIVEDVRVGITQAADFPWRFLAANDPHVSVPHGRVKPHQPASRKRAD